MAEALKLTRKPARAPPRARYRTREWNPEHAFAPSGEGEWAETDWDGVTISRDASGTWGLRNEIGALLGQPEAKLGLEAVAPDMSTAGALLPPKGLWRCQLDGSEEMYELTYLSSVSLATARQLQDTARDWEPLLLHLEQIVGPLSGRIFDLGCGAGAAAVRMAKRPGTSVIGMDWDASVVAAAATRVPREAVAYRVGDVGQMHRFEADAGTASGVWCSFTAAYFPGNSLKKAIIEWVWLLKPGGWICIMDLDGLFSVHSPYSEFRWARSLRFLDEDLADAADFDPFVGERLVEMIGLLGLEVLDTKEWVDAEYAFQGPASEEILAIWRARLENPVMKKLWKSRFANFENEALKEFFGCLKNEKHSSRSVVRTIICVKPNR